MIITTAHIAICQQTTDTLLHWSFTVFEAQSYLELISFFRA